MIMDFFFFEVMKILWNQTVVMVTQFCEYTKAPNSMACELQLNFLNPLCDDGLMTYIMFNGLDKLIS